MRNQGLAPTTCSSPKNNTMHEEPHLSGAYIRSLVKHLSSSSTKRSKDHHHITTMGSKPHGQPQQKEQQAPSQTPPPPKKQVRRRLHTSRPYQERLLNMAEARREIVTALKIHRASMRQAKEQQLVQQLQHQQDVQVVQEQFRQVAWSVPMSSYGLSFSDNLHNSSPPAQFTATSSSCSYYSSPLLPCHTPVVGPMVPMVGDALDHLLPLPAQPLGLNLSFHGFGGVVAGEDDAPTGAFDPPPLLQPSPASSYSVNSSPPLATPISSHDMSSVVTAAAENASLHRVLDDEEMAAICSAGKMHDIEWSDTMNLATSAWWSKLLDSVEGGDCGSTVVQQRAEGANAVVDVVGMHLSDEYYGEDVSLPRMDIGEIEGWDTEWLS